MQTERVKPDEASRFRILTEISQQITSILDINELLVQVVRLIQRTFNYYHVGIGLVENDEVVYRVGAGALWDDPEFEFKPGRLKIGSEGLTGWVADTGEPALVPDVSLDPHYVWMQGSLTKSELMIPINVKGKTIGVLDVQSQHVDDFDQSDKELMQAIASQTGVAIENARLFAETQHLLNETKQRADELTLINNVQQGLASKLDAQSIYELVGDTFHKFFNAQVVMISSYDPKSNTVEHRYSIERGRRVYSPGLHQPGGFRSQIIQTKQPVLVNTNVPEASTRLGQPVLPGTAMPKSWLGVPILSGGQVTGILSVQNLDEENAFSQSDIRLLQTFASSTSIALENARLFAETQRLLEETEERNAELAIINSMQLGLASKLDIKGIYELVGEKLRGIFGVHGIVIYSFDHEHQLVVDEYAYEKGRRYEIPPQKMTPLHEKIIRTGETVFIQENAKDFFEKSKHVMPAGEMPRSLIIVPFKSQGLVAGMIGLFDIDKDFAFTDSDVRLMETLTNSMIVALESARLFAITQHRAEQFRVLTEVSQHIISLASVDELLNRIAQLIKDSFGYIHVGIGLVERDQVVSKAEVGAFEEIYHASSIPLGEGVWGKVAQNGTSMLSSHVNGEKDHKYMHNLGIHSHLCVPLRIKDKVIGVISAASDHGDAFDQSDETILQTLSNQVSVAIENARLYEQARHLAVLDERQRLSRELHDSVTQSLYGISLYAQAATGNLNTEQVKQARQYLEDIQNTAQESMADMRLLIYELRPPILEKEGLISALQHRLISVEDRARIKSNLQTNLSGRLPAQVEQGIYQITREALNNIIKHAKARNITIRILQESGSILVEILDDGVGFELDQAHHGGRLGLVNMQECAQSQGWKLDIKSSPGNGTHITVEIEKT